MLSPRFVHLQISKLFFWARGFIYSGTTLAQIPLAPAQDSKSLPVAARARVDLDALVRVESKTTGSDGVTRTSLYQETYMRRGEQAWTQRIRPKQAHVHGHV